MNTKTCPRCGETKPWTDFYIRQSGRQAGEPGSYCKPCTTQHSREYNEMNKERIRARVVEQRYGITQDQLERLSKSCEICGSTEDLHIDHDHVSRSVRGVLCGVCNRGVGMFKDDPVVMSKATKYIQRFRKREADTNPGFA